MRRAENLERVRCRVRHGRRVCRRGVGATVPAPAAESRDAAERAVLQPQLPKTADAACRAGSRGAATAPVREIRLPRGAACCPCASKGTTPGPRPRPCCRGAGPACPAEVFQRRLRAVEHVHTQVQRYHPREGAPGTRVGQQAHPGRREHALPEDEDAQPPSAGSRTGPGATHAANATARGRQHAGVDGAESGGRSRVRVRRACSHPCALDERARSQGGGDPVSRVRPRRREAEVTLRPAERGSEGLRELGWARLRLRKCLCARVPFRVRGAR
mmetsp:Transcript_7958/g.23296  ORF Transcript_7958/g.23296 Transcript_7958/m.23296 type:complete len:273 (+) Transcript_7958:686-1504(+)